MKMSCILYFTIVMIIMVLEKIAASYAESPMLDGIGQMLSSLCKAHLSIQEDDDTPEQANTKKAEYTHLLKR